MYDRYKKKSFQEEKFWIECSDCKVKVILHEEYIYYSGL